MRLSYVFLLLVMVCGCELEKPTEQRATRKAKPAAVKSQRAVDKTSDDTGGIAKAFRSRKSDLQVRARGVVIKILPDDTKGSRHQRFILRLSNGQTVLIAHNIDRAPRIPKLKTGDTVEFYGEYEWNEKGGVVHWTHRDPKGRHTGGWLKHKGKRYR